uniref:Fatty acid desaturase domain-containing protein n=1 Tax=Pyrodinium bahamense TaxID=73915 RepID=A0A7S0FCB5_9DINO|mmetsp:Transcript_20304/g.56060  ORF Transcript_20304/g.56060 Transcript_20304/m.56060 type:complete len:418 (+) Transcript_20304:149-1402(+)
MCAAADVKSSASIADEVRAKFAHSTKGHLLDGTPIDLAEMDEILKPNRRESLIPFHNRKVAMYGDSPPAKTSWDGFLAKLFLRKPIDLPILSVFLSIALTTVPSAFALAYVNYASVLPNAAMHAWGVAHVVVTLVGQAQGFILGLHYSSHVRIWKPAWEWLDGIVHCLYCALFGIPCGAYYCHHVIMHHKEDNQINYDASTTMPYQRDNKLHLHAYCLRYILGIWFELPTVLFMRDRWWTGAKLAVTTTSYFAVMYLGMKTIPIATSYTLLVPFVIISFALMRGNQLQHIFVSPDDPTCDYKLSYDMCNTTKNQETFNDGFHVEHHVSPNTHWADLPLKFLSLLPKHKELDSLIFTGLTNKEIQGLIYSGKLDKLADHYVNIGQPSGTSKEVLVAEIRRRLSPIYTRHRSTHRAKVA